MKELDSEVAGGSEDSQSFVQPKSKNKYQSDGERFCESEQPSGLLTQEIGKDVLFGCESTNSKNVQRLHQWKVDHSAMRLCASPPECERVA